MNNRRLIPTWLLLVLSATHSLCQQSKTDSLRRAFEKEQNRYEQIRKGISYCKELVLTDPVSAIKQMEQLKEESRIENRAEWYGLLCSELAGMYYSRGDYISSIVQSEQSIKAFGQLDDNKKNLAAHAFACMWAGLSYSLINDWENAQQYFQTSIGLSEKAKDSCKTANSTMNLAYIYYDIQDWQHMKEVLLNSIRYLAGCNDPDIQLMTYSSLIISVARLNKVSEAAAYLDKIERLNKEAISTGLRLFYDVAMGEYALTNKNNVLAVSMYRSAYKKAIDAADPYTTAFSAEGLGRAYAAVGNLALAEKYLEESLLVTQKNNFLSQQQLALSSLSALYAAGGDFEKAWQFSNRLIALKNSLTLKINANRRLILEARFEAEKKETRINRLEAEKKIQELTIRQKNTLNYILVGSIVTLLAISVIGFRNYRQKQKLQQLRINELETEKQLAATEAVLKGEEQERTRLAKDLHDGLGGMLSGIKYALNTMKGNLVMTPDNEQVFERSMDMLDSSIKEIRRVAHNMMPEALMKFGLNTALKDFCSDINQSGAVKVIYQSAGLTGTDMEQTVAITIFRIVQELVNNIIKHAAARQALVQVNKINGQISITVEDDGKGFSKEMLKISKGMGWANIENRVEFLKGRLDVLSELGKGTSVHIEIIG